MNTDPIKLVQGILAPKSTSAANNSSAAKPASSSNDAYKLANSLKELLENGPSGSTTLKGNYTAKGLQEAFQSAHEAQTKKEAASSAAPKVLDNVLKSRQDAGTNTPTLSAQAQEIVKAKQATSTDVGLAKIDEKLAQTVGISRVIGSA